MSNILSLEELNELLGRYQNSIGKYQTDMGNTIAKQCITLCETAIEYHRRWQELVNGLNNLPRTNDNDMGWYVPLDSIIRLIDSQK